MTVDLDALLSALKSDPVPRDAIRREVLTEDLLALPGQVARLAAHTDARFAEVGVALAQLANRMDQLTVRIDQLTERVDKLAGQMAELVAQVGTLAKAQQRMGGEVSRLVGAEYEAWALRTARPVARAVGAPPAQVHPISAVALDALLTAAEDADVLEPDAADDLALANGIFVWEPGEGSPPVYAVVEVSVTAKSGDVDRAVARANLLAKTGGTSRAVVLRDAVADDVALGMKAHHVGWQRVAPRHAMPMF
ncbi:MAG: hypothetical protein HKL89_07540 [Candidatus Dormibacteraeota bacterium]|nr:hypothetical protein [Candidatus Dormibacteraeota bacterium]